MKIETKFDLGQQVWSVQYIKGFSVVVNFTIDEIRVRVNLPGPPVSYTDRYGNILLYEEVLFLTQKEAQTYCDKQNGE